MINLEKKFKNIYIEKGINLNINNAIYIDNYKEIFNRPNQNYLKQKNYLSLIIANKKDNFIYPLSKYCDNYGLDNVYYTSNILNCIYNCKYCYLQGMYNSGYLVYFYNYQKMFEEVLRLKENSYINISYDTDILALNDYFNMVDKWLEFIENKNYFIEIRTKSNNIKPFKKVYNNVIVAYSISPQEIINNYELRSSSLKERIKSINYLLDKGYKVQLSFEPMIYLKNFEELYLNMFDELNDNIDLNKIYRITISSFRISKDFLMRLRNNNKNCNILYFPFEKKDNMMYYGDIIDKKLTNYLSNLFKDYKDKVFVFEGE